MEKQIAAGAESAADSECSSTDATDLPVLERKDPATLDTSPLELLSQIAEVLSSSIRFASLLNFRLLNKSIGGSVDRILQLRAARAVRLEIFYEIKMGDSGTDQMNQ
jgi:hypothetical protein